MNGLWVDVEPAAARRLLLAALDAFAQHGYFATTTREISQRAEMSPAAVYVHYPSKADMLAEICRRGHAEVLEEIEVALQEPGTPTERVQRFVQVFSSFHARRQTRRPRDPVRAARPHARTQFREVADMRARFEQLIRAELQRRGRGRGVRRRVTSTRSASRSSRSASTSRAGTGPPASG